MSSPSPIPGPFTLAVARTQSVDALVDELMAIDDEASELFRTAGITLDLPAAHPFVVAERTRWARAAREGQVIVAIGPSRPIVAFAAHGTLDGLAYLDQLAVRPSAMRNGLGQRLTEAVVDDVRSRGARALWLTTYGHLSWNAPFYERLGFARVHESECGPELRATLADQRRVLPRPEERVAMVRAL